LGKARRSFSPDRPPPAGSSSRCTGAATAPQFYLTDCSFLADFNWDLDAANIAGGTTTGTTGAATKSDTFEPGDYGGRYIAAKTYATTWASVVSNPAEGTVFLVIRPQFAATAGTTPYLFEWYIDANNTIQIAYFTPTDKFIFSKVNAGSSDAVGSGASAETFASDTYMVLAISWGTDGMKIYKDGTLLDSDDTVTDGVTGSSGTVYLGHEPATNDPDCKYDFVFMMPFQLANDDVARISLNPTEYGAYSTLKSKTGNIDANDRVIMDFENMTVELLEADLSAKSNDIGDWDGNGFPILRPPQMCLYIPSGKTIGGVKVAYRKRYL